MSSKKSNVQMPQSTAGLVRYFESSKEAIQLKPEHILVVSAVIIAIELALRFGLFGI